MLTRLAVTILAALACGTCWALSPNEEARFLAGLPVRGSAAEVWARDAVWVEHATAMDAAWDKQDRRQIGRVREWARKFLPAAQTNGTAYYMFSGPDFPYAHAFFPNASTYIMVGTEPVGRIPDFGQVPSEALANGLAGLRQSMKTMLSFHYFVTKEMRVDLVRDQLGGVTPILFVFMARLGLEIREVTFVKSPASGVKIVFSGPGGRLQTVYYFDTDLSGGGQTAFLRWCAQQGPGVSLLKAASYLPHSNGFAGVREFLLQNSTTIVQDDSGIPFKAFDPARWNVRLFGNYQKTIPLFAKEFQPGLAQAYLASNPADLGFSFSYHWHPRDAMLMLVTRR